MNPGTTENVDPSARSSNDLSHHAFEQQRLAVVPAIESPGDRIHRKRLSHAEYRRKKQVHFIKNIVLAVLPFVLFAAGLTLMTVGVLRYIENETVVGLLLAKREPGVAYLGGAGWNTPVTPTLPANPTGSTMVPGTDSGSNAIPISEKYPKAAIIKEDGRVVAPFFSVGSQIGTIRIPSVDIDVKVFQGDSEREFRQGAGHSPRSLMPGQGGNILIASHRTSYFRNFEYLKVGDMVTVETTYGTFTYRVREFKITRGSDESLAKATNQEQLTMYTCYPFTYVGNAPKRYFVLCDLVDKEMRT